MNLGGTWRAVTADHTVRRSFSEAELDDGDWEDIEVPHHWRSHPAFSDSDGPLLYRRRFETPVVDPRDTPVRTWLQLDGLFYQGDVWLDGSYLGDTEGYFFPHVFEVTETLALRSEHLLALELTCDRPSDKAAKHNLTGVFQDSDFIDAEWNPGGIWRPVRLLQTGPVRLAKLRVRCSEATSDRATADLSATLDALSAGQATVTTVVTGPSGTAVERTTGHPLAAGANEVRWRVPIEHPALWWPHALGAQPLYDVTVTVSVAGVESDRRVRRTGLRQVRMRDFVFTVNGERLFLKGSNQGPTRRELGDATPEQLEGDVLLAREAGLDLLRVHGHISRPELYDAADRHGMLLWQDLPSPRGYSRVRTQAVRQAGEAVDLLGHHPSVALWCGHNEPVTIDRQAGSIEFLARQVLPTWTKSVLDRSIYRALKKADPSRPVVAHSGVLPHPAWGTDSHLFFGWYRGEERDLPQALARLPVLARFVSEFGAQAVPEEPPWEGAGRWPDLDWDDLARTYCLQKEQFDRYVPPDEYATFEEWRDASQAYQASVVRYHVETLRRLKYRPTGGFCQFYLGDSQPAVTCSVLDDRRRPKAGWAALVAACAPVIVVADRPAEFYAAGEKIEISVHVVSDLRVPIHDGAITATVSWPDAGRRVWRFSGGVDADVCAWVGAVQMVTPDTPGPLVLDLDLTWPQGKAHNQYLSHIVGTR